MSISLAIPKMQAKPFNLVPSAKIDYLSLSKPTPSHTVSFNRDQLRSPLDSLFQRRTLITSSVHHTRAPENYKSLFVSQRQETPESIQLPTVDGSIPDDFPMGTYYLIGPGLFSDDHGSTVHPLDGHGYLRAFEIDGLNREVRFSAKYVKTAAHSEEFDPVRGSWKFTHRGPFSVLKGGRVVGNTKVMKNVANTTVLKWGGRLFCLWEGGAPYEIQPGSLDTLGRFDDMMDGDDGGAHDSKCGRDVWDYVACLLKPLLHGVFKMPKRRILAHYKIDVKRQRLLMMACNAEDMLLPRSHFTFYEYDSNFSLIEKLEFNIGDHLMVHDWAFTDSHYLLFGNRVQLHIPGLVVAGCGVSPMISALSLNPSKQTSPLYLLPRWPSDAGEQLPATAIDLPSQLWLLHVANAYEEEDEQGKRLIRFHATACSYEWFSFQNMFGYEWESGEFDPRMMNRKDEEHLLPHFVQVSVDLDGDGKCTKRCVEPLKIWTRPSDFPVTNPKCHGSRHQYVYAATASGAHPALPNFPFDSIVKLDTHNEIARAWSTSSNRFIGEPMFVAKATPIDEDDGYLLMVEYAVGEGRCYLVMLNAKRMGENDALVARFEVPRHLTFPMGFHGAWDPLQ